MGLFKSLNLRSRRHLEPVEAPPPIKEVERIAAELEPWANSPACKNIFLPHLDSLIANADVEEGENLSSHVAMAFARGKREALKELRKEFTFWTTDTE